MFGGKLILLFIVHSCIELCVSQGGGGASEPVHAVYFDNPIYTCPDGVSNRRVNTTGLEINYYNETMSSIGGVISFMEALPSKNFRIEVIAKKEVSGKFEVVVTKDICDLCDELHPESEYWKYIRFFGLPPLCPFAPADYFVSSFVPDKDDLPVNSANAAAYQVEIHGYYNKDGNCNNYENKIFMFCLKLDFMIDAAE